MESGCILNRLATHSRLLGPTFVLTSRDTWGCHPFAGITSKSPGCRSAAGLGVSFVRPAKWMTACPFALQLSFSCCRVLFVLGFGAVSSFCSHCPFGYISFRKKKKIPSSYFSHLWNVKCIVQSSLLNWMEFIQSVNLSLY